MESPGEIAARFDQRAEHYDDSAMHRDLAAAVAEHLAAAGALEGTRSVLDVATGTGLVVRALLAIDDALHVTGVDISDGMLAVARSAVPATRHPAIFINSDAARLPFDDASFGLISCVTALHLLPDATAALREWRRVLQPGGRIALATFAVDDPASGQRAGAHARHGSTPPEHHALFGTPDALETFAESADLRVTRVRRWSHPAATDSATAREDVCLIAELTSR